MTLMFTFSLPSYDAVNNESCQSVGPLTSTLQYLEAGQLLEETSYA